MAIERVHGLPVRTAIGADMTSGVMAASHHQVSLVEAQDMPGSTLAGAAWTRATKPLALILKNIGKGPKADFGTSLGARPVVETDELQTLLAEPDTALVLLNRGRVPRRDIIKLKPLYPPAVEAPKSDPVAKAS